jgi:two-component system chemotaxis response regulator CheB
LVAGLPKDFPASILIVLHFPQNSTSMLPHILERSGSLPARHAEHNEQIQPGRVYVAPPGRHMLLKGDTIRIVDGPKENANRPAIDPLFRSAAHSCGECVAGVILTGLLDDGTLGMANIKRYGGVTIAQSPNDATFPDMPRNAIIYAGVDYALPLDDIPDLLVRLATEGDAIARPSHQYTDPTEMSQRELHEQGERQQPSTFTCPECHGTLFDVSEEGIPHFRCRVGHAYSIESLEVDQRYHLEAALWAALRSIEENNSLLERMIRRNDQSGFNTSAMQLRNRLNEGNGRARLIRDVLTQFTEPIQTQEA